MDHHGQRTIASNWRPEGGPSCFAAERRTIRDSNVRLLTPEMSVFGKKLDRTNNRNDGS